MWFLDGCFWPLIFGHFWKINLWKSSFKAASLILSDVDGAPDIFVEAEVE